MEEAVGIRWHHFITRMANRSHPAQRIKLEQEQSKLAIVFRALGGDAGLSIRVAAEQPVKASRTFLQKVAGSGLRFALAWRDADALYLPDKIDFYPSSALNQDLYLWLTALASCQTEHQFKKSDWFIKNQQNVVACLEQYPGLHAVYQRLVAAEIAERDLRLHISPANRPREHAIRTALRQPGQLNQLPKGIKQPDPVPLWLYPGRFEEAPFRPQNDASDQQRSPNKAPNKSAKVRRQAEYADEPDGRGGLLLFRLESLFSWSEFLPLDRTADDNEDDDAEKVAEDLDRITLSRNRGAQASKIRMDLDLPSASEDDIPLGEGIHYPEWDYRKQLLLKDHCTVIPMLPRKAEPCPIPDDLKPAAKNLRRLFSNFNTQPIMLRRQIQGQELDINAALEYRIEQTRGHASSTAPVWKQSQTKHRDLACLVLADLSLSTDAWANNDKQVIDVIRESLHLLGEALHASQDDFAMYGFSSRRRNHVRYNLIKNFNEPWSDTIHGRIKALEPGYYTRMGAAIRQSIDILKEQPAEKRLLLILTDGKPNDLDIYEGRYGVEDTRMAINEAHREGLETYCVNIDQSTGDYIPYVFGQQRFYHLNRVSQLPKLLPRLYLNLTGRML